MVGSNNRLGVLDVVSGRSYDGASTLVIQQTLFTEGTSYATLRTSTASVQSIDVFDITVPMEPAALRTWLRDVTNMRDVPGSEVVTWP
jgi:hypothetical protein